MQAAPRFRSAAVYSYHTAPLHRGKARGHDLHRNLLLESRAGPRGRSLHVEAADQDRRADIPTGPRRGPGPSNGDNAPFSP